VTEKTLFDELGGEARLRSIIDLFVDRVCNDTMIGFFFAKVDRTRLKQMEYELAAEHLGAGVRYSGRPLDAAHARHPIMGGQFMRRLQILKDTLAEAGVPDHIQKHWIDHTLSLRALITRDEGGRCDPDAALQKTAARMAGQKAKQERS
jgi:truncated hemoglobin YjbI